MNKFRRLHSQLKPFPYDMDIRLSYKKIIYATQFMLMAIKTRRSQKLLQPDTPSFKKNQQQQKQIY